MKVSAIPVLLLAAAMPAFAKPRFSVWPSKLMARATDDPEVRYPLAGTVWTSGDVHNITWSTEGLSPPMCGAVMNSALFLAADDAILTDGSVGSISNPISSNFSLSRGYTEIYVRNVTSATYYQIVLKADTSDMTDEGSFSGQFVITPRAAE
ncbi:hypothetical protein EW145_g5120 [Phellinidium pouzarii]|uniref:Uncharacterized protein n=1 Tax=Phellinidium pouzarii TaxID=167371 RepID=A0A4S4L2I5_9AGAM|nr:hypothetical protein EW145_g5120 [Phellinidium pouzarii]